MNIYKTKNNMMIIVIIVANSKSSIKKYNTKIKYNIIAVLANNRYLIYLF